MAVPDKQIRILWVDDEIEHLRAHLLYLKEKGYQTDTATNGQDAIEMIGAELYDLVFWMKTCLASPVLKHWPKSRS